VICEELKMTVRLGISVLLAVGLSASAAVAIPLQKDGHWNTSHLFIKIEAADIQMRSAGFLAAKLQALGFKVVQAAKLGQVYTFRVSKNGFTDMLSVDARNAKIIGVNTLTAPADATPSPAGSEGNHFSDETYEFGYSVSEADFSGLEQFSAEDLAVTDPYVTATLDDADYVPYDEVSGAPDDSDDLDKGEPGDAEGNALVSDQTVPEEPQVEDAPPDGAIPAEPGADETPPEPN
jgi:hypothetical protein